MKRQQIGLKPQDILSGIVRLLLAISILDSFIKRNYFNLLLGFAVLILTYLPYIIIRISRIMLPPLLKDTVVLFVFSSIYLGNLNSFYHKFLWWDWALHLFSGIILGFIGLVLLHIIYRVRDINIFMAPFLIGMFMFLFALGSGTLWEIYEFIMDSLFNMDMQLKSLSDTMTDLIADSAGALLISIAGFRYECHNGNGILKKTMDEFFELNSEIFKSEKNSAEPRI